ncbi:hypothetical protein Leryth_013777 [Lithospermum erythrorhizon]|nr:hypothetical protein Leryth_013777 [Lithospermum erythrorhizon]
MDVMALSLEILLAKWATSDNLEPLVHTLEMKYMRTRLVFLSNSLYAKLGKHESCSSEAALSTEPMFILYPTRLLNNGTQQHSKRKRMKGKE